MTRKKERDTVREIALGKIVSLGPAFQGQPVPMSYVSMPSLYSDPRRRHSQVFGLERFRETELIHGRWAMLATLGVVVAEGTTGVAWQDAGKVELDGTSYLGLSLPFTVT